MRYILSIDPGSEKCGYAIVFFDLRAGEKGVVFLSEIHRLLQRLCVDPLPEAIVLGGGTGAGVVARLVEDLGLDVPVRIGDEKNTTYEARARYFADNPPTGIWRFVPLSLQLPDRPIDDYAALLIGERYLLQNHLTEERTG